MHVRGVFGTVHFDGQFVTVTNTVGFGNRNTTVIPVRQITGIENGRASWRRRYVQFVTAGQPERRKSASNRVVFKTSNRAAMDTLCAAVQRAMAAV